MLRLFFYECSVYSIENYSELVTLGSLLYHCKETGIASVQFTWIISDVSFWWDDPTPSHSVRKVMI